MDWGDLEVFVALARSGSLSEAARQLKVEHSTVARRIAALEGALGVRLFDRMPRGYVLTAEGEEVVGLAEEISERVVAFQRRAQGSGGGLTGSVRLSAPPTFASHFLAPRLVRFRALHPGILLELVGDSRAADLSRREADLAVRLSRPRDGTLVVRKLGAMSFGLYGARARGRRAASGPREYLGYDEALGDVPQQRWLRSLAGERPLVFRANDLTSLHHAARAGMGLAVLPRFLGDADRALARVSVRGESVRRELWLLVHEDLRRSPRVRALMDFLVEELEASRDVLDPRA